MFFIDLNLRNRLSGCVACALPCVYMTHCKCAQVHTHQQESAQNVMKSVGLCAPKGRVIRAGIYPRPLPNRLAF